MHMHLKFLFNRLPWLLFFFKYLIPFYSCQWHNFNSFYGKTKQGKKNFVVVFVSYKKKSENKVSSSSSSSSCLTTISTKSLSSLWSLAFAIRIDDEDLEWERGRTLCGNQFQSMKQNRNSGGWALITFRYHHDKRINI